MKIAVLKERRDGERRVAASPDSVQKFVKLGCSITIESGAGDAASISDDAFKDAGAEIAKTAAATVKGADVVLKIGRPLPDEIGLFSKGQALACHAYALTDGDTVAALNAAGVTLFAMELVPRITRAQSMDILSSQANMAGYKSVLDALEVYGRALPMMSTAAGKIPPANVFIMGVGVAGLQAIATAKRLGAIVWATDVRPDTKEQVESLGGKFLAVENEEFEQAQTAGGYAKEMSDDYKRQQAELVAEKIQNMDIVITTALIPGRPAPVLVTEDHVKSMKPGSVIVDLAVEAGGNCPLSEFGKTVTKHGVTLVGHANVPSRLAETTSQLFARNLLNFLTPMVDKETAALTIDLEDEVVAGALVCKDGAITDGRVPQPGGEKAAPKKAGAKTASKKGTTKKAASKKSSGKKATGKKATGKSVEAKEPTPADPAPASDADSDAKEG